MKEEPGDEEEVDERKRAFLRTVVLASGALALGGAGAVIEGMLQQEQKEEPKPVVFPRVKIKDEDTGEVANVNTLEVNEPLTFNYPLTDEPNVIVKLGQRAEAGVGPDGDIVAFSTICQHLGCVVGYVPQGGYPACLDAEEYSAAYPQLYCCCHYAVYNLLEAGALTGQGAVPVPQVALEVDKSGDIYAVGMGPPAVYGHGEHGSGDVALDLQGGTLVQSD